MENGKKTDTIIKRVYGLPGETITDGGMVFFEIGCSQADAVAALMKEQKIYDIKVEKDLAGLDRVVWGYVGGQYV